MTPHLRLEPSSQGEAEQPPPPGDEPDALAADVQERRHQLTLLALADVDAGRMIDDEDMRDWVESLGTDHELPAPQPR